MAKGKSNKNDRLNAVFVLGFVIITMALLVVQLGMDLMSTIEQQSDGQDTASQTVVETETAPLNATPGEPTPTFDIGSVKIHG